MTALLTSASKIVFIMMALTVCIAFVIGRLEAKDFMVLASMAFSFYFAVKPTNDAGEIVK